MSKRRRPLRTLAVCIAYAAGVFATVSLVTYLTYGLISLAGTCGGCG